MTPARAKKELGDRAVFGTGWDGSIIIIADALSNYRV
jgi:hypothetical protein